MLLKTISTKIILFFACWLICIPSIASDSTPITVTFALKENLGVSYQNFLKKKQKKAIEITHMDMEDVSRGIIRLVILEQALFKAGLAAKIVFLNSPNAKRSQVLVQSGEALISTRLLIDELSPKGILKSSALVGYEDLKRGIYGLKSNNILMKVKTLEELKKLSAVTLSTKKSDIKALHSIGLSALHLANDRKTIFNLIAYRKIDFTLLGVRKELEQKYGEITLVPVPNLLIQTNSSMHFFISKKHQYGQMVYQALEKGLAIMSEQGLIKKYYQHLPQSGDFLQNWKILNNTETVKE